MQKNTLLLIFIFCAILCHSQQTIFLSGSDNKLYTLNLSNCLLTIVNNSPAMADIAVSPNGNLWGYNMSKLWSINQVTGQVTEIAVTNPTVGGVSLVALNNTTLLFENGQTLCAMNTANAQVTFLGSIGYTAAGDLTWYNDKLYMPTPNGLLIKITLNTDFSAVVSAIPVNELTNPIPYCEAMITAEFEGYDNALVGFAGNNVYKICPIDGSYELLCPALSTQFPGADSMRLNNQLTTPITCNQELSISKDEIALFTISPNPIKTNDILKIQLKENLSESVLVELFDLNGHKIVSKEAFAEDKNIILNIFDTYLSAGLYILKMQSGTKLEYLKLIIQ